MVPEIDSSIALIALMAIVAYLLGSIPFGLVISKAMGLGDVRDIGSGNIGATNVLRTGSKPAALATVFLDAGKGLLAVALARTFAGEAAGQAAALAAFLGHLYPVWIGFKGGKGVATLMGVLVGLSPGLGLAALGAWLFIFFTFRISSLSALFATLFTLVAAYAADYRQLMALLLIMGALLFWKHRENIHRLYLGEEPTVNWGGK